VAARDACSSVGITSRRFLNKTSIVDSAHCDTMEVCLWKLYVEISRVVLIHQPTTSHGGKRNKETAPTQLDFETKRRILFEHMLPCNHQNAAVSGASSLVHPKFAQPASWYYLTENEINAYCRLFQWLRREFGLVNTCIRSSLVVNTISSYTLKITVTTSDVTSHTKSSNSSGHTTVPLELQNSSEVNSHSRIISYSLGTDHAQKTQFYCCVAQTTLKTSHVITISPVHLYV
jgi:hypothetical protein